MIDHLLGPNYINLGYTAMFMALLGLIFCGLVVLPQQIKEAAKNDGIRNTRISLPIINFIIILVFGYALYTTATNIFVMGKISSPSSNMYRFAIGIGVFLIGLLLLIIYKRGGHPTPSTPEPELEQ